MMLLQDSQDLLYIVLSLSVLWFTVFLCWLLYQTARVLRNANRIIENVTEKLELIAEAVEFIRDRIDGLTSTAGIITKMMGGAMEKFVTGKISTNLDDRGKKKKTDKKKKK